MAFENWESLVKDVKENVPENKENVPPKTFWSTMPRKATSGVTFEEYRWEEKQK